MKYLGIDYGEKRVGLALSDPTGSIAFPLETVPNDGSLLAHITKIIEDKMVRGVVVGDTRAFGGKENPVTKEAEAFVSALKEAGFSVEVVWEAGSSVEASRYAEKGDEHKDEAAAAIILQRFLDVRGSVE